MIENAVLNFRNADDVEMLNVLKRLKQSQKMKDTVKNADVRVGSNDNLISSFRMHGFNCKPLFAEAVAIKAWYNLAGRWVCANDKTVVHFLAPFFTFFTQQAQQALL